jgi:hypothetical protein
VQKSIHEQLFNSPVLLPYYSLHCEEWIRMEFKTQNKEYGQVRIYILPDDVGRASIPRQSPALRKSMKLLLAHLDISNDTWNGSWDENVRVVHVDPILDDRNVQDDPSLFQLFNSLPSPNPDPDIVSDYYARGAMQDLLDNNVRGLKTMMYNYQCRSAALMLQREVQPTRMIDPRLRRIKDQSGATWYCDISASSCLVEPRTYETAQGGICAETMGLGKTLICLALILATRDLSSHVPVEHSIDSIPIRKKTGSLMDMCANTIGRSGTPWKNYFAPEEAAGYDLSRCKEALVEGSGFYTLPQAQLTKSTRNAILSPARKIWLSTATMVVVPSNLIQQWQEEIKKHVVEGALKVLVMKSSNDKLPPAKVLVDYDIILFTKERFKQESKDGFDEQGRHIGSTTKLCRCPYIGATRIRACTCFNEDDIYRSPLKDLHFKRLITDEGHTFGNSSSKNRTETLAVVDDLRLDARWIVSGTPTQGLYGVEIEGSRPQSATESGGIQTSPHRKDDIVRKHIVKSAKQMEDLFNKQERKDLEKLGNIAISYLKARPWANGPEDKDYALWKYHVMQPRHGSKSHGNLHCLRATLESMIIRHRPEDVQKDVSLPPLHQKVVYLDGSMQDVMSLNTFAMMIVGNAVTSERKDADYLFHPGQAKELQRLVSNLRQASFFWSGFQHSDIVSSLNTFEGFLEKGEVAVSPSDRKLLETAIIVGKTILCNDISRFKSTFHEMPVYLENNLSKAVKQAWASTDRVQSPTLIGDTSLLSLRRIASDCACEKGGASFVQKAWEAGHNNRQLMNSYAMPVKAIKHTDSSTPMLAGSVSVGNDSTRRVRTAPRQTKVRSKHAQLSTTKSIKDLPVKKDVTRSALAPLNDGITNAPKIKLPPLAQPQLSAFGDVSATAGLAGAGTSMKCSEFKSSAKLISSASAKLSYLIDRIFWHEQTKEKVLVFYESDNVAFYVGEALELLGIKHLFFAKTLMIKQRAEHIVEFNTDPDCRVLIMDVSQAAFGLDLSSASRVYFINPILNPQVEAQAIKRAHRIGQRKDVYVETLVLKGSIEELILSRRKAMSPEEHKKCKNILDDDVIYDWIRNARFLELPTGEIPSPEQMAKLSSPLPLFQTCVPKSSP